MDINRFFKNKRKINEKRRGSSTKSIVSQLAANILRVENGTNRMLGKSTICHKV